MQPGAYSVRLSAAKDQNKTKGEIAKMTQKQMTEIIGECGFTNVSYQMEDAHAVYYDAMYNGEAAEVKIVHEDGEIAARLVGFEDWNTCDHM